MPEDLNGTAPAGDANSTAPAGQAPAGTGDGGTEDPVAKIIEDYRKRQAGAERARQEAERVAREAQAELAALKAAPKAPAKAGEGEAAADIEARMRELEQKYEQRLKEQVAAVEGKSLDARFPAARAKFPEVTDPVKLAELEGLFGEPQEPPKVLGNNQQRTAGTKNIEDMTSKELQAYMKSLDPSVMGLSQSS